MGEFRRVEVDVVLLSQSAKARDIEYAGHRLELLFADPVLYLLLPDQVMVGALHSVPVDLADWVLRREARLDTLRQRDKGQLVNGLDTVEFVVAVPVKIQTDIGQAIDGNLFHRFETRHAAPGILGRNRDQPLDLLCAQAGRQRQHLGHRLNRVRISLDVELRKRIQAGEQEQDCRAYYYHTATER